MPAPERTSEDTLALLKALGDDTRFRCLAYVRHAGRPVTVAEVALELGLHQNTVRPHLERLRDVGLLEVSTEARGTVGRPQHRYKPVEDTSPVGLGPRGYHLLSELLAMLASRLASPEDAREVGREWGIALGAADLPARRKPDAVRLAEATFGRIGFQPTVAHDTVTFCHCPFRELAEAYPDLICSLHHGLCEGVADLAEAEVAEFNPLYSRTPCTVVLTRT